MESKVRFQIYRTNSSSYQDAHFFKQEKAQLESIPGVKYVRNVSEFQHGVPFILITNTHTEPESLAPKMLENTRLLVHPNSGYDNFSKPFVEKAGFPIIVGNPIRANAVAEYSLSAIFHHYVSLPNQPYWSSDRKWNRKLLRDQKALILGNGKIGKLVASSLKPLCSSLDVYDPFSNGSDECARELSDDILRDKDIIVVAASLTSSSRNMINADFLKRISSEALIVNAARGEIICEEDLIQWLQKNSGAKAFLDVFAVEPFSPGHMSDCRNINKTSHIAGVHEGLNEDIIKFEKTVIEDFCSQDNFVNKYRDLMLEGSSVNFR